jgi:MFS family permease
LIPTRPGKRTIVLTAALHGHVHVMMVTFAAVQDLMAAEFDRTHGQIGFVGFWSYLAFGLGALPAGLLADRLGSRRVLEVMLGGAATAGLLLFWARSVPALTAGLFLLGLSCSLYHPAGLGLMSRAALRGRALAVHGIGGSLGLAAGPALAGGVAALAGQSWRAPYLVGACGAFVLLAALAWDERHNRKRPAAPVEQAPAEQRGRPGALAVALLMMVALGVCYRGTLTFLPEVLGEGLASRLPGASTVVVGGLFASLALGLGVAGQWLGGAVLFHRVRLEVLFGILLLPCLAGLFLLATAEGWWLALGACLFGFFFFAAQPVGNGLVAVFTSEAWRSTGYGVHFMLAFGFGSFGAWLAGRAIDQWGHGGAFWAMLPFCTAAVILAGLLSFRPDGEYPS